MASLELFSFPLCLRSRAGLHVVPQGGGQVGETTELFLPLPRTGTVGRLEKGRFLSKTAFLAFGDTSSMKEKN